MLGACTCILWIDSKGIAGAMAHPVAAGPQFLRQLTCARAKMGDMRLQVLSYGVHCAVGALVDVLLRLADRVSLPSAAAGAGLDPSRWKTAGDHCGLFSQGGPCIEVRAWKPKLGGPRVCREGPSAPIACPVGAATVLVPWVVLPTNSLQQA